MRIVTLVLSFVVAAASLRAHDPGLSTLTVTRVPLGLAVEFGIAPGDLALLAGDGVDPDAWAACIREFVQLTGAPDVAAPSCVFAHAGDGSVVFQLAYRLAPERVVGLRLGGFDRLGHGHACYARVVVDGTLTEALLGRRQAELAIPASAVVAGASLGFEFLELGVEHVLIGFDHILFLLSLLLVVRGWRQTLGVISAFTVAHSLTLILAVTDVVRLPGPLVESVIAASIVFVAVENVVRRPRHRFGVTFGFGLVHGFGFAGVLQELMAESGGGVAVRLLAFNAGVELGQLLVAAAAVPVLILLRRSARVERLSTRWLSVGIACTGAWWVIERTLLG